VSINRLIQRQPLAVAAGLGIVIFILASMLIQGFGTVFSLRSILVLSAFVGIASVGQTLVILLGGIDLSIPFIIGFGNVVAAELTGKGVPFWQTLLIILVIAGLIGAFNGSVSSRLGIHPLILTLGVGNAVQGSVLLWTRGLPAGSPPKGLPWFVSIGASLGPFPFPALVLLWLVLAVIITIVLLWTVYGRQVYALGSNPVAARFALVRPTAIWTVTFTISAMFAALAGVLLLGFTGSAMATVGDAYMFQTIGAVVVGGTAMVGGRGSYVGTVIGSFVLIELTTMLIGLGVPHILVQSVLGLIIVILVSVYGREPHVRDLI
jgi:ribose transport system permease protein